MKSYTRAAFVAILATVCLVSCGSVDNCEEATFRTADLFKRLRSTVKAVGSKSQVVVSSWVCSSKVYIVDKSGNRRALDALKKDFDTVTSTVTLPAATVSECLVKRSPTAITACLLRAAAYKLTQRIVGPDSTYDQAINFAAGERVVATDPVCKDGKFYLVPEKTETQRSETDLDTGMAVPAMMLILEEVVVPTAVLIFGQNECTSEVRQCSSEDGACPESEEPAWEAPGGGDVIEPGTLPGLPPPDDGDHL